MGRTLGILHTGIVGLAISGMPPAVAQQLQVIGVGPGGVPICNGPLGPGPCPLVQQWIATHVPPHPAVLPMPGQFSPGQAPALAPAYPAPSTGGLPPAAVGSASSPQQIAIACAQARGQDVAGFVECTGASVILPQRGQDVLDCAVDSSSEEEFASCAAPKVGIKLTDDQRTIAKCAMDSNGDEDDFTSCAGNLISNHLTNDQRQVLSCAQDAGSASDFASCAAKGILGARLSKEQQIAVECAADSGTDYEQFASCAGTKYLQLKLNAEQQIAVQCVVSTGGQPYAAGGCMVSRWTARELEKCFTHGFGGSDGCYGDNNELVGKNGWVMRTFRQIAGGPNSVVHNPQQIFGGPNSVFNNPAQLAGGPNSIFNNPRQILGGPNSVVNNPGQIFGGPNSVINNPGQFAGGPNSVINNPGQLTGGPNSVINNPGQILGGPHSVFHCPFGC